MKALKTKLQRIDSKILSDYVLDSKGAMSHLKLQKLIYFIEGYHLAYFDESLIDDEFQAWVHGPVSRKIYDTLKDKSILYGDVSYSQIAGSKNPKEILSQELASGQLEIIDEVLELYGNDSGLVLENITHTQTPWINARKNIPQGDKCENTISKQEMHGYFKQFL